MNWLYGEPDLEGILADPVVRALMKGDHVDAEGLRKFLHEIGARIGREASPEVMRAAAQRWILALRERSGQE